MSKGTVNSEKFFSKIIRCSERCQIVVGVYEQTRIDEDEGARRGRDDWRNDKDVMP